MFPEETRGRQEKLQQIIYELSKEMLSGDENQIKSFLNRLILIYEDNFKHKYSDFFPVLLKIYEEDNEYNIDYLSNNLDRIGTYLESGYSDGNNEYSRIYTQFTKLCDHLNLQICQLNYVMSKENSNTLLEEANQNLEESNEKLKESLVKLDSSFIKLEESNKNLEESNKKASTIQTELIAVLSIFAAIVITFSGGVSFLGSAMTSINNAKYYEVVVLVAIICGLVIFDTIFLMMYLVSKIIDRNIYARCTSIDCFACGESECRGITKIKKRLPYVFYFNVLCIVGIIIDMIVWAIDIAGMI